MRQFGGLIAHDSMMTVGCFYLVWAASRRVCETVVHSVVMVSGGHDMPKFDPDFIQIMRTALEEAMTPVPLEYSTPAIKAHLAECILKAAAQGQERVR